MLRRWKIRQDSRPAQRICEGIRRRFAPTMPIEVRAWVPKSAARKRKTVQRL